jgi:hypothetical protein
MWTKIVSKNSLKLIQLKYDLGIKKAMESFADECEMNIEEISILHKFFILPWKKDVYEVHDHTLILDYEYQGIEKDRICISSNGKFITVFIPIKYSDVGKIDVFKKCLAVLSERGLNLKIRPCRKERMCA